MSAEAEIALERGLAHSGLGSAEVVQGQVPVIDLGNDGAAELMWKAATSVGFFLVTAHGISQEAIDGAFGVAGTFFAQPVAEKEKQSPFAAQLNSGFEHFKQVRPSTGTVDQKESVQITTRDGTMDGRWPTHPPEFRDKVCELAKASHRLAQVILDLLEPMACPHLKPGTLSAANSLWTSDSQCTLRMLHYPSLDQDTQAKLQQGIDRGEQHWRAGPHTDWCCVTLLFQREGEAGLECAPNPKADSPSWLAVDPMPGAIAVNIGDMLARWSDGRLLSNLHRVRLPKDLAACGRSRYSMAFFAQADKSCIIESNSHEPITAGNYILSRIQSNFEALKATEVAPPGA